MTDPGSIGDMPADGENGRALWRRSRSQEMPADDPALLLDLAAFAEGGLDPEEAACLSALVDEMPEIATDIAVARSLAGTEGERNLLVDRVIARAASLEPGAGDDAGSPGNVVEFRRPLILKPMGRGGPGRSGHRELQRFAQWGSVAAAVVLASWLGFAMGRDASSAITQFEQPSEDGLLREVFDPSTGFMRDLADAMRT
jgi:hypothetical protein